MKKLIALALALILLAAVPALAEGKLEVEQEVQRLYAPYVFTLAKIRNVGDAPVEIGSYLELLDAENEILQAVEYNVLGTVLQPGEYTYGYFVVYLYGDTMITGFTSEWEGMEDSGFVTTVRYESKAVLDLEEDDCVLIYFTNNTDETIFAPNVAGILLDGEGGLLAMSTPIEYDIGITPGSTVIFRCEIPYFVIKDLDPDTLTVDSAVFTERYN